MLTIDGSKGEGGGQILRSSLALSLLTQTPFQIKNIRANRQKPGLMRQHLTSVLAAKEVGVAEVQGAEIRSTELRFSPKTIAPGNYKFCVGTAGSTSLVFQTVLPALLLGQKPSHIIVEGGTHNSKAPPFDFLEKSYLPLLQRMGPEVFITLEKAGFYPAGGGRISATIKPVETLRSISIPDRGNVLDKSGIVRVSQLPMHIAEREKKVLEQLLRWGPASFQKERVQQAHGPGNVVLLFIESEHITEVFCGFGAKRVRAEEVAGGVAREALRYLETKVPVGEYLADQLLLPMAIAGKGSFRTVEPSLHTKTHLQIIETFLGIKTRVEQESEDAWWIEVFHA